MTRQKARYVDCPRSELAEGASDIELVKAVQSRLKSKHPHLSYEPEQILIMAY
jgi:hypothetical protein